MQTISEDQKAINNGTNHKPAGPESKILGFRVESSDINLTCSLCFSWSNDAAIKTLFVLSLQVDFNTYINSI